MPAPPSAATGGCPSRAVRKATYAERTSSGRLRARHRLEPLVGHLAPAPRRRPARPAGPATSASTAGSRVEVADQHVVVGVPGLRREPRRVADAAAPAVVEVQRGPVVDHPEVAVPEQQVGVAPRAVHVRAERVQPDHPGRLLGPAGQLAVEAEGARQEVHAEVEAGAGVEQVLHLLVRLVAGDLRVQLQGDQVRGAQPDPPGQLADDHLGDQHPQSLAGAAELADVGAQVVGLDDARAGCRPRAAG